MSKKNKANDFSDIKGNYFSIRQYTLDQWNMYYGEPFLILKTVRVDKGKFDSSYTTSDTLNWGNIFKEFFATEISDRSYLGKYKFTQFDDDQDETHNFFLRSTGRRPVHTQAIDSDRQIYQKSNRHLYRRSPAQHF